jgi:hypothetical protein
MKINKISAAKITVSPDETLFDTKALYDVIDTCADGAEIIFEPGCYYIPSNENAVKLKNITKRITIRAEEGVRLIGGQLLSGAKKVEGTDKARFYESVRDTVYCVDLKENGVASAGTFASRGFGRPVTPSHAEVFADKIPLSLSQYPKNGEFLYIKGFVEAEENEWADKVGKRESGFLYDSDRPKQWADVSPDSGNVILTHGYWSWDWANSYERVAAIDKENGVIKTKEPYCNYAFKTGQRFSFYNIREEVTDPGDYYIDRELYKLYFIPRTEKLPGEILISTLTEPLLKIDGCENISLVNLTIESTCGCGIQITSSKNIKIDGCDIHNIGNYAVTCDRSVGCDISGCEIYNCGDGGIQISCGNRKTLEAGGITVKNNHIYKIAQWTRTYQTAVNVNGVGVEIDHNLIHDCPHTGILFNGNDITITNNEIYSCLLETGDAGAVYIGRDYTYRGNVVSKNYIHHMGGVGMGTMGIYNDDCVSGTVMEENLFCEVSRAVFLGGGRDFIVRGNLFVDCHPSIEIDGRGTSNHKVWRTMVDDYMRGRFYSIDGSVSAMDEPYISRYPELRDIDAFYKAGLPIPPSALIENNVYCSHRKLEFTWDVEPGEFVVKHNKSIGRDYFTDYKMGLFNINDGTDAEAYGFKKFDMLNYGLENGGKTDPPRVMTAMKADDAGLEYYYKNLSDKTVSGEITLYSTGKNEINKDCIIIIKKFALEIKSGEEGTVLIPYSDMPILTEKNITLKLVDARSDTAGIRPCRLTI